MTPLRGRRKPGGAARLAVAALRFDITARRRWRLHGAAAAGAGLVMAATAVLVVLWWWRAGADDGAAAAVVPPHLAADPMPPLPVAQAAGAAAALSTPPAEASAAAASEPAVATHWELCGIGRVPVPAGAPAASGGGLYLLPDVPEPLGRDALTAARQRTLSALQDGDLRSRAAAVHLAPPPPIDEASRQAERVTALAALASGSSDPAVLQWAAQGCRWNADATACRASAAHAWVQADPDNAAAWNELLAADPAASSAAWAGMLQARRWDIGWGAMAATVQAAVPADVPAYLRLQIAIEIIGVEAAFGMAPPAGGRCRAAALAADPQRRSDCSRLAETLVQSSDQLLLFDVGRLFGERVGWPAERVAALKADSAALLAELMRKMDAEHPYGCATAERFLPYQAAVGRMGQIAALRATLRPPAAAASALPGGER